MLTIHDRGFARDCRGRSRREFLRVGSLGLGLSGLTLPGLLAARAQAGESSGTPPKAVVLLFLQGGPSQHETWDPKPEAPKEYRTHTDCIPTAHPGIQFCRYFPKLAAMAKDLTVLQLRLRQRRAHLRGRHHRRQRDQGITQRGLRTSRHDCDSGWPAQQRPATPRSRARRLEAGQQLRDNRSADTHTDRNARSAVRGIQPLGWLTAQAGDDAHHASRAI